MDTVQQIETVSSPLMTKKRFAEVSGLTEEILRGMIQRGHLPTKKIGKHRLINVSLLQKECLEQEHERF